MSDMWLSPSNNSDKRAIREVQMALGLHPDGQYSRGLVATVSDFQATNDLLADGLVGPLTWAVLQGTPAEKPKKKPAAKKKAEPKEAEAKAAPAKKAPASKKAPAKAKADAK